MKGGRAIIRHTPGQSEETMVPSLDRYIARQIFTPMAATMALTILLLLLDKMLRLFQFTLNEGGPLKVVFDLLVYMVPEYAVFGAPISLLLGILLAYRRIAMQQEMAAMLACRFSPWQLLRMPMVFGVLMTIVNFALVSYVQPHSEFAYRELTFKASIGAFGRSIQLAEFVSLGKGTTMRAQSFDRNTGMLSDIFLYEHSANGAEVVAAAKSGQFLRSSNDTVVILRLEDGQIFTAGISDWPQPGLLTFDQHDIAVPLPLIEDFRNRGGTEKERTLAELISMAQSGKTPDIERRAASGESQRRIILGLLPLVLPFLAVAIAAPPPRRASASGIVIGLSLLILMFKLLEFGSNVTSFPPGYVLWPVLAVYLALGLRCFYVFAYKCGQHPLDGFFKIIDLIPRLPIVRWLRRRKPSMPAA